MTSEVLNGLMEGLIAAIVFGGIFVAILRVAATHRRRLGKVAPIKPVWLRVTIGGAFCIVLQAAGFQAFGLGALVLGAMAGYWSWDQA